MSGKGRCSMAKVLIEICVPAIDEHFDVFVPVDVPIQELNGIIANGISELTNGKYIASERERLCLKKPAGVLQPECTLQDYGIKNGMQLYLI